MKILFVFLILTLFIGGGFAQDKAYTDSIESFRTNYITNHEVVKAADKKYFRFFPVNSKYLLTARFEKLTDTTGFLMKTSGKTSSIYFRYGLLYFTIDQKEFQLTVYQSKKLMNMDEYRDYLFVPYTDLTSGEKSYGGGKYIDFSSNDIRQNTLKLDFNKAYNPYCAYATGFNCPVPPRENDLPAAIEAGELEFGKKH
jgi:uncharacterized protein (DUF1684 family)